MQEPGRAEVNRLGLLGRFRGGRSGGNLSFYWRWRRSRSHSPPYPSKDAQYSSNSYEGGDLQHNRGESVQQPAIRNYSNDTPDQNDHSNRLISIQEVSSLDLLVLAVTDQTVLSLLDRVSPSAP